MLHCSGQWSVERHYGGANGSFLGNVLSWGGSLENNQCNSGVAIVNSSVNVVCLCPSPSQEDKFLKGRDTSRLSLCLCP